ncbi:MAG: hypothetical protein Q9159_006210 [Coniocarpon cinnabarinum]
MERRGLVRVHEKKVSAGAAWALGEVGDRVGLARAHAPHGKEADVGVGLADWQWPKQLVGGRPVRKEELSVRRSTQQLANNEQHHHHRGGQHHDQKRAGDAMAKQQALLAYTRPLPAPRFLRSLALVPFLWDPPTILPSASVDKAGGDAHTQAHTLVLLLATAPIEPSPGAS